MSGAPVAVLEWDSAFFGFPVARVTRSTLGAQEMDEVLAVCGRDGVRCLYLLLDAGDAPGSQLAQERGFRLYDVRMELDRLLTARPAEAPAGTIGPARPEQRPALERLARERFVASRFFADPGFARDRARELFVAFLERGLGDAPKRRTLVSADASGFVICRFDGDRSTGVIELIGVAEEAAGTGVGDRLMRAAEAEFAAVGMARCEVVTQARNVAAQRLYQRLGYRTGRVGLWFHRWFD